MAIVKLSPSALNDLQKIKAYISDELSNPIAAERTVKQIMDDYMLLEVSPYMGPSLSVIIHIETDFRYLVSGSYIIFYKVNDENVLIYRILNGRMDYLKILFGKL